MIYLVDTNILLRIAHRSDERYRLVRSCVNKLKNKKDLLQTTMQNFAEFWNVSTRPIDRNGLGLTLVETDDLLHDLESTFPLLPDSPGVYAEWRELVVNYGVSGVQVHDARLVATMLVHGVTHILTFNTSDFARYNSKRIVAVDPATV